MSIPESQPWKMKPKNCLGWLSSSRKGGNAGAYHLWRWDSSLITAQLVHYVSVGVWVLCHQSMFSGGMNEATAIQIIKSYLSMPTHRDMLLPTMGMVDQWLGDFVLMPLCPSLEWVGWCSIGTLYVHQKNTSLQSHWHEVSFFQPLAGYHDGSSQANWIDLNWSLQS